MAFPREEVSENEDLAALGEAVALTLIELIDRRREYRRCVEGCAVSPGYWCANQAEALDKAAGDFAITLRDFIRMAVAV